MPPVDAYLGELAAALPGPRRRRDQILAELADGLHSAIDERVADGAPSAAAEREAIARFGPPRDVADAFAGELATAYARRCIVLYVASGPVVGIWWLLLLQPHPWRVGLAALLIAVPVLPLVTLVVLAATATLATTGRLMRWLPETSPGRAVAAAMVIASLAIVADVTVSALWLQSGGPWRGVAVVAVTASGTRIACSAVALSRAAAGRPGGPRLHVGEGSRAWQ